MVRSARMAALAVAAATLVGLTGCGSGPQGSRPVTSDRPATRWAGAVCSSELALSESLSQLTARMTIRASATDSTLSQAKHQLGERTGAVERYAAKLATVIGTVPASAGPQAPAAGRKLAAIAGLSQQVLQRMKTAAAALQDATTPAQFVNVVMARIVSEQSAASSMQSMLAQYVSSSPAGLKNAFRNAPSCTSLPGLA